MTSDAAPHTAGEPWQVRSFRAPKELWERLVALDMDRSTVIRTALDRYLDELEANRARRVA